MLLNCVNEKTCISGICKNHIFVDLFMLTNFYARSIRTLERLIPMIAHTAFKPNISSFMQMFDWLSLDTLLKHTIFLFQTSVKRISIENYILDSGFDQCRHRKNYVCFKRLLNECQSNIYITLEMIDLNAVYDLIDKVFIWSLFRLIWKWTITISINAYLLRWVKVSCFSSTD